MTRGRLLLLVAALASVVVPFLVWQDTWFGRPLDSSQLDEYLHDDAHPRHIQHALSQIADRITQGDPSVTRWYPRIADLARHSIPEIRATAAWTMGQDNTSDSFHQALLSLLADPKLMVRRNAALALVRFQDASGRGELLQMLRPYTVRSPCSGPLSLAAHAGQKVGTGTLLARVGDTEVRSPYAARVEEVAASDGATLQGGARIASLEPGADQAWEALRALYLIGRAEDLPDIEPLQEGTWEMPDKVRQQAVLTAQAIRAR